jgi:ABC-type branched-subunit amino acid transport system substrate-binding protein
MKEREILPPYRPQMEAVKVFISYAQADEPLLKKLILHLSPLRTEGKISIWDDGHIKVGTPWEEEIYSQLDSADIFLLLISPSFSASKFCQDTELPWALERNRTHNACVIPILLMGVDWRKATYSQFQVLPRNARFIEEWQVENLAFLNVAKGIREAVEQILEVRYRHLVKTILKDNGGIISEPDRNLLNEGLKFIAPARASLIEKDERRPYIRPNFSSDPPPKPVWDVLGGYLRDAFHQPWSFIYFLVIGLAIALFISRIIVPPSINLSSLPAYTNVKFSWGDKLLLPKEAYDDVYRSVPQCLTPGIWNNKTSGTREYAEAIKLNDRSKFRASSTDFSNFLLTEGCMNDPESRIYLNNAEAEANANSPIRIAISVPISRKSKADRLEGALDSKEFLLGAAVAQEEINTNKSNYIDGRQLVIGIADDGIIADDKKGAEQVATFFVENPDILGVVGHYNSDATEAAGKIYSSKIAAISSGSTAVRKNPQHPDSEFDLDNEFFRTSPTDAIAVSKLIGYIRAEHKSKVAIVYEEDSLYSRSFKKLFKENFDPEGKFIVECNLQGSGCDASDFVANAKNKGAEALLLIRSSNNKYAEQIKSIISKAKQSSLPLLGGDVMYDELYRNSNAEGMVVAVPWYRNDDQASPFEQQAALLFGENIKVNWRSAMTYDATQALAEGLRKASKQCNSPISLMLNIFNSDPSKQSQCLRSELKKALSDKNFRANSVVGKSKVLFDDFGDRNFAELSDTQMGGLVKVQQKADGSYRFVPIF